VEGFPVALFKAPQNQTVGYQPHAPSSLPLRSRIR
jgi:hypothetical protein